MNEMLFSHTEQSDIPNLTTELVQYAADNVDHTIHTLEGYGTFHGMGMIAAVTLEQDQTGQFPGFM